MPYSTDRDLKADHDVAETPRFASEPAGPRDSRRSFLRGATVVAVPGLVMAASSNGLAAKAKPKPKPMPHPMPPPAVGVDRDVARVLIREIMNDEAAHVPILQKLLKTRTIR